MLTLPSLPAKQFPPAPPAASSARDRSLSPGLNRHTSSRKRPPPMTTAAYNTTVPPHQPTHTDTPPKRKASSTTPGRTNAKRSPSRSSPSPKLSSPSFDTRQLRNDRLGTLVSDLCRRFQHSPSWESFASEFRGPSYLAQNLDQLDHPAADLLRLWRDDGIPVHTSSPPWTTEMKDACIQRGCHHSATQHAAFLRNEMADMIENQFWMVLPYDLVRDLDSLMLSPCAIKEERDRRPRLLCDHSWDWGWPSVNETTLAHTPPEAMQFGGALPRIFFQARHANPKYGPVRAAKHDVKDAFFRGHLKLSDCPKKALILPRYEDEPQLIGIPMSCTMGWVQSPPTFCAISETICDTANLGFLQSRRDSLPVHRLEEMASAQDDLSPSLLPRPHPPEDAAANLELLEAIGGSSLPSEGKEMAPPSNRPLTRPVGSTDVFVDDFIQLGQGGPKRMNRL